MKNDIFLFPLADWTSGAIISHEMIVFQPHFLTSPMQPINEVQPSRHYALTLQQARNLVADLQKHIQTLENAEPPKSSTPQH